ncbi:MAG: EAL domain-containing protein [Frankiaceae bacterium]
MLLSVGLLASAGAVAQQRQQARTLQRDAAQVASAFSSYFERARSLDLLLAQNPAFSPSAGRGVVNGDANRALKYLEELYPGAIGEACLIDDRGRELARVTEGAAAPVADLSTDEAGNPFFTPTLALGRGQVYQAAPYVSPDTKHWVISNSTWIRQRDGRRLIVHFEVALDSFQQDLATGSGSQHVAVVDRATGHEILHDRDLPATNPAGRFPQSPAAAILTSSTTSTGTVTVNGRRLEVSGAARTNGNVNDWAILEWSTGRASSIPPWVGGAAAALGAGLILWFLCVLRRQHGALRMAARLDHLTGMANRKALEEALDRAVAAAAAPGGERVAVLMLDLDGFKQINDTLGHDKGDLVLQEIGRRLHSNTFEYDTAARLGGDEFAVVLRQLREADDVSVVAHRLREALIRPIDIDGVARFIGASVGAAVYAEHGRSSAELLRAADAAMYQAKRDRDGVRVYDAGTASGATASWLAAELLLAIETEQLTLAYQPEYALNTGQVVGVEALARWHRPGEADVAPSEFIPLAERTGLIRQLTHLTIGKALDEARIWHAAGVSVPVSVNLSAQLVTDRSLPADVDRLLNERGLSGAALVLEITETAVIKDVSAAADVLHELRTLGVRIELDDFGSGYASFRALHELPLDGLKIDRDLVNDLGEGGQRLLAATIDIGRGLGLKVVAEGIEGPTALELVHRLGADTAQGFYLARPMSPDALHPLLGLHLPVPPGPVPDPSRTHTPHGTPAADGNLNRAATTAPPG